MSNSFRDYKDTFRSNLPTGVTYDSDIARYFVSEKRFVAPYSAEDYSIYVDKFDVSAPVTPSNLYIPSGSDALITSDGDTFTIAEA